MKRWTFPLVAVVFALWSGLPAAAQEQTSDEVAVRPEMTSWQVLGVTLTVAGKTVEAAPPGESVRMRVQISNSTEETATDVTGTLDTPGRAKITDATDSFGTITGGQTGTGEFSFTIDPAACDDTLEMVLTVRSSIPEQAVWMPVAAECPGPRLFSNDVRYEGGDGDGVPEPGERLEIFVVLHNAGRDGATDVRARLEMRSGKVTVVDATASWPDLAPGQDAVATSPFVIQIADDADVSSGCGGMGIGVVDPGDGTVSSDGSDPDKPQTIEPMPPDGSGSGSSSSGGGSTGSTGTATASDLPAEQPPQPGTVGAEEEKPEDAPVGSGDDVPAPPPEEAPEKQADPAAQFEGALAISTAQGPFEAYIGSLTVCALQEGAADGAGIDKRDAGAGGERSLAADSAATAATSRGGTIALASLLALAAAAVLLRYRVRLSGTR